VRERVLSNPPAQADPRRLLVRLGQAEAKRTEPVDDLRRQVGQLRYRAGSFDLASFAMRNNTRPRSERIGVEPVDTLPATARGIAASTG
jgi:hypothetical protein